MVRWREVDVATGVVCGLVLLTLVWPPAVWAAFPASVVALVAAALARRRAGSERRAVDEALSQLAEYRLPLSLAVRSALPPSLRSLVEGYDTVFERMRDRQDELAERVQRYAFMELHTEDILTQVDALGRVKYASPAMQKQLGWTPDELKGRRILDLLHPDHEAAWVEQLRTSAQHRRSALLEGPWRHKDGHYVTLEMSVRHAYGLSGALMETISVARNVEARNLLREQLTRAALTDPLTGLPNRAALVSALERGRAASRERPFVLFLFDLDRFKQVNDSLGHAAGDRYLIETAARVRSALRPGDTLARMGGDEFVALFEGIDSEKGALSIAQRILEAVGRPYECEGVLLHPRTSIGIVLCGDPQIPADELIQRADRAMYEAKRQGGNLAIVYDGRHSERLRTLFEREQALARALQERRLVVHFQPIVDARTHEHRLAEALLRVRAEDGRLLPPLEFIEAAEQTGQILQVGREVLAQACRHARRLDEGGTPCGISVNVSPRQLMHVNFVRDVESVLEDTGVSPSSILLEVTESAVMEDMAKAKSTLLHLRSLGFRLALDDFGTGHSSISLLHQLPFDLLKIDRAFVREVDIGAEGPSTLHAIIEIGRSLKLTIIAEGVETDEQARGLERLGCELLQGFHFHRPMDAAAHAALLAAPCSPKRPLAAVRAA